ncbi:hypothetical protein [Bosea sp. MMO-172]|uniref:hypothetical protein n=1 Tax=Bosea sp. MMO-172 TaxID=3127885 RepID=UPI003019C252
MGSPDHRSLPNLLSDREDRLVELLAAGTEADIAFALSGYPAETSAYHLLSTPRISRAIEWRMKQAIKTVLAPRALRYLSDALDDEAISPRIRAAIARDLIEKAGIIAPRAAIQEQSQKTLAEMSPGELADIVSKLETELASRAKDVSAPNAPAVDGHVAAIEH